MFIECCLSLHVTSKHCWDSVFVPLLDRVNFVKTSSAKGEDRGVGVRVESGSAAAVAAGEAVRDGPLPLATGWRARPHTPVLEGTHYWPLAVYILRRCT